MKLSVIIPALNEEQALPATLHPLTREQPLEIIVVDGGSRDRTREIAAAAGTLVLHSSRGRAAQMNAGAARATGDTLLFLHADTILPQSYQEQIRTVLESGAVAGAFRFRLDRHPPGAGLLERLVNIRSQVLQMPYGDQGIFLERELFQVLDGYRDLPILEDLELVDRLRNLGRIRIAPEPAVTSSRRWLASGIFRETLRNMTILAGYRLGVPPQRLVRLRAERPDPTAC